MIEANTSLSANKQALLLIRQLKQQLAESQQASRHSGQFEPIAIVSMACRFPQRSKTPAAFWQSLIEQTDEVGEIPADRWDLPAFYDEDPETPGRMYARHGVFLKDLDQMDPEFFGISPREATWVDPQQRLLMEVGWEALERAFWRPEQIAAETGVFVGWMHNDYQNEASDSFLNLNPYIATGAAGSFLSGRLAYYLGLEGPSIAIDTACSSSLVALHLACQSLQQRDCGRALVGGVNAICSPTTNILTCKLKALSPSGHSRAFDAAADGYLRGEGCGVIAIRRLDDALADGDPVLGVIRGSAIGHNGFSSGLTAPNPKAQQRVIQQALARAGFAADQVGYLEAHGTGTELGDPIEMQAAAAALGEGRNEDNPLLVGSVKTNIGHLEAAAGMAGLIKVLLAMQHDIIPGQLNFETPNPHIPWEQMPVQVLTEPSPWPLDHKVAGVSAFGMSGANAHVVIEAAPISARRPASHDAPRMPDRPQLLVLGAKTEAGLEDQIERHASFLRATDAPLDDVAYTLATGRTAFEYRAAVVADNAEKAASKLESNRIHRAHARRAPRVLWQFTGQGSQWFGMGRQLYDRIPLFRDVLDECDQHLRERASTDASDVSLLDVMFRRESNTDDSASVHQTQWTQPAIFAIQMGLAKWLEHCGHSPDMVMGHSVGQYAAACVAGIFAWHDGLCLIAERGRMIGELPRGGRMIAVFATEEQMRSLLPAELSIAALNGSHIVVSGPERPLAEFESRLSGDAETKRIRFKPLTTSHAFHSSLMDPVLAPFAQVVNEVPRQPAAIPLICNVSGKVLEPDAELNGEYWAQHIRQAVRYAPSIESATEAGCELLLELGPQPVLTRMAEAVVARVEQSPACIATIRTPREDVDSSEYDVLDAIAACHAHGVDVDFEQLSSSRFSKSPTRVQIPTYPFQRQRYWGPDKPRAFHAAHHTAHPLLGESLSLAGAPNEQRFQSHIESDSPSWLVDHQVMGQVVMPGAALVELAWSAPGVERLNEVRFHQPLRPASRTALQTVIRADALEVFSAPVGGEWTQHLTAIPSSDAQSAREPLPLEEVKSRVAEAVPVEAFYEKLSEIGLAYGTEFQTVRQLFVSEDEVLAELRLAGDIRGFRVPPPLLDGALHCLAVGLLKEDDGSLFLPVGMKQIQCSQEVGQAAWCLAKWTQREGELRTADVVLLNDAGQVLVEIDELQVQRIDRAALRRMTGAGAGRLLYELEWAPTALDADTTTSSAGDHWLLVAEENDPLAQPVHDALAAAGAEVHIVGVDVDWSDRLQDKAASPAGIAWLLSSETQAHCEGLIQLAKALQTQRTELSCGLQLITRNGVDLGDGERGCDPSQSQYWGLGRVIGAEHPELRCRLIDVDAAADSVGSNDWPAIANDVSALLWRATVDNQWVLRASQWRTPRLRSCKRSGRARWQARPDSAYLVTGGLGMLGIETAKWLAERGASQIVLVSRRQPNDHAAHAIADITAGGCEVTVHSADLAVDADVASLLDHFNDPWLPLAGIVHAAGVLDDGLLVDQSWERFEKVLGPKVEGSHALHEKTSSLNLDLDLFVLFSSAASVLGSPGQSNYATGNAFMDGLAWQRRAEGLPALSLNWGPWAAGMANDPRIRKRLALQGISPLSAEEALAAMEQAVTQRLTQATVMDVEWGRMQWAPGRMLEGLIASKRKGAGGDSAFVAKLKQLTGPAQRQLVVTTIQETFQSILGTADAPDTDRPLIEMGLDSLMAVEFGSELQQLMGDEFPVGPTMLFDHPSIDAIADHVVELISGDGDGAEAASEGKAHASEHDDAPLLTQREDIAIVGLSCRFPGARSPDEFWNNLMNGVDSVCQIPDQRWDIDRFYSAEREPGKMYTREGGFLDDIGDFDADFFNLSAREACWMDPQHRMLLENSYLALEDAGISPHPLADANVGVFMGIMGQDYAFLPQLDDSHIVEAFEGAGLSHSAGVGRISYTFGFEGPSVAIDTASSSSLVALHQAMRSLQDGVCNMALAGGVNAILAPVNSLLMSKANLLAPDGRCKSFSAAADGFGRGEGCGVVVLKRLSDAARDGDRVLAVLRGGAVVHNGFSSGITAPSGKSQGRAIAEALRDARVAPSEVQYLEAHGTGTEFGDPMELAAAAKAFGQGRKRDNPLLVGSVKGNIAHLEAAGGVSGLIKTVLAIHHGVIPPQANFDEPSPHVPWKRMPLQVVTEATPWPEGKERIAGVTALGLVGTNAHVIVSSAPCETPNNETPNNEIPNEPRGETTEPMEASMDDAPPSERSFHLLPLSARDTTALAALAGRYRDGLSKMQPAISDVCYTAGAGRRHFEARCGLIVKDCEDAIEQLEQLEQLEQVASQSERVHQSDGIAPHVQVAGGPFQTTWVFPSRADNAWDAARSLWRSEPDFRTFVADCDAHLERAGDVLSLTAHLSSADSEAGALSEPIGLYLLQAGLAQLWRSWGVGPDAAAGWGVGQYTAAAVAGCLCFKDALLLVQKGFIAQAEDETFDADAFESFADQLNFYPPSLPLVCSLTAAIVPVHKSLGGSYWREHLTASPDSLANGVLGAASEWDSHDVVVVDGAPCLRNKVAEWPMDDKDAKEFGEMHARLLAEFYVRGANIDFAALHAPWKRTRIRLPSYPFRKQRYWITEIDRHEIVEPTT